VYLPPFNTVMNSDLLIGSLSKFSNTFTEQCFGLDNSDNVILLGDFNLPGYNWNYAHGLQFANGFNASRIIRELLEILLNLINSFNLRQFIVQPNSNNTFLDLAFSNIDSITSEISYDPMCKLEPAHFAYVIDFVCDEVSSLEYSLKSYDYVKGDYLSITKELNDCDFSSLSNNTLSLDDKVSKFYSILNNVISRNVPSLTFKHSDDPPWFSKELKEAAKTKRKLHYQWKLTNDDYFYDKFKKQRSYFKYLERCKHTEYLLNIQRKVKKDPKKFWTYARIKDKRVDLPGSMVLNDMQGSTGIEIVNMFAQHFYSVYDVDNSSQDL